MEFGQITSSEPTWSTLSSTVLPGGYEVGEILAADTHHARFRIRVLGDWSAKAFLDAFSITGAGAREQIDIWTAAKQLQHPNLSSPLAAGEFEHDGAPLIYVAANAPDETLARLLQERAVTAAEAVEIVMSVSGALRYLNSNALVHGHLSPDELLAFGDSIRISSAYALPINAGRSPELITPKYVAPELTTCNTTPAADIWCLGATLSEALTQQPFSVDRASEAAALPKPFDRIVQRCTDPNPQTRCTLPELEDLALNRQRKPEPAVTPEPKVAAKPEIEQTPTPPVLTRVRPRESRTEHRVSKLWLYAAGAVVIFLLLLWAAYPHKRRPTPAATEPPPIAATPDTAWQTKTLGPKKETATAAPVRRAWHCATCC